MSNLDLYRKDEAAAELYIESGGKDLAKAHARISRALSRQGERLEEHFNTPYTEDAAKVIDTSTRALVVIAAELRKWHELIYPNGRERRS